MSTTTENTPNRRIKTRYTGVYVRYSSCRICRDGRRDKCYYIQYSAPSGVNKSGKIWERVGWRSEGYSVENAIELRGMRIRQKRHPEMFQEENDNINNVTLDKLWNFIGKNYVFSSKKRERSVIKTYNCYLKDRFGDKIISELTAVDAENFKNWLMNEYIGKKKGLRKATVSSIVEIFIFIINRGIDFGIINDNIPFRKSLKLSCKESSVKRMRFLTKEEIKKLLDYLHTKKLSMYLIVKVAIFTGMRLGEILHMRWSDINLEQNIVQVDGKTGKRYVVIPSFILKELIDNIDNSNNSDYVFKTRTGNNFCVTNISYEFSKIVDYLGYNDNAKDISDRVVFHTLRHTFCSQLALCDIPIYTISELAGHSKVDMTKRYAKITNDYKREALNKLKAILDT